MQQRRRRWYLAPVNNTAPLHRCRQEHAFAHQVLGGEAAGLHELLVPVSHGRACLNGWRRRRRRVKVLLASTTAGRMAAASLGAVRREGQPLRTQGPHVSPTAVSCMTQVQSNMVVATRTI